MSTGFTNGRGGGKSRRNTCYCHYHYHCQIVIFLALRTHCDTSKRLCFLFVFAIRNLTVEFVTLFGRYTAYPACTLLTRLTLASAPLSLSSFSPFHVLAYSHLVGAHPFCPVYTNRILSAYFCQLCFRPDL